MIEERLRIAGLEYRQRYAIPTRIEYRQRTTLNPHRNCVRVYIDTD